MKSTHAARWLEKFVDALELATDDDLSDAILRFAELRKRRTQSAGAAMPQHLRATA